MNATIYKDVDPTREFNGVVIYDGDGDGTSAAAIWLINRQGDYVAVTNKQKNDRELVGKALGTIPMNGWNDKDVGIFDIDAEQNHIALERLAQSTARVQYFDHHTRNPDLVPSNIDSHVESDTRSNCTASITHKALETTLSDPSKRMKATQLAIIGLSNDGKRSAAESYGTGLIQKAELSDLLKYSKAINFGSGNASLDSVALLKGFVDYDIPLEFLKESTTINDLVDLRDRTFTDLLNRSEKISKDNKTLYVLPHSTESDRELSVGAYNDLITSFMEKDSAGIYIMALKTPEDKWRLSFRCADESKNAFNIATQIATIYGTTPVGRTTAAGFDVPGSIDYNTLWNQILQVTK